MSHTFPANLTYDELAGWIVAAGRVPASDDDCLRQQRELATYRALSDARAALHDARINFWAGQSKDGSIAESVFDDFVTGHNGAIDRALAGTHVDVAVPTFKEFAAHLGAPPVTVLATQSVPVKAECTGRCDGDGPVASIDGRFLCVDCYRLNVEGTVVACGCKL